MKPGEKSHISFRLVIFMNAVQSLSSSTEDYLEAIFTIVAKNKVARSKDIAEKLKVKRPSVTGALKALAEKGLVNYAPHSYITLSKEGEKIARCVDKRHQVLKDLFVDILMLPSDGAENAACVMEHGISQNVCKALRSLLAAVKDDDVLADRLRNGILKKQRNLDCENYCENNTAGQENRTVSAQTFNLNMLATGESGIIGHIVGNDHLKKRLREMGITAGQEIRVIKSAPLDDPIEIKIRNYNISLRREEADKIVIKH